MNGPFYVRNDEKEYVPAEKDGVCGLAKCIVFPDYEESDRTE